MSQNLIVLFIYAGITVSVAVFILTASYFIGPRRQRQVKNTPYECGMPLISPAQGRFSVKFYLVAMAFLLFDIETVFLIPWALVYKELGMKGFFEAGIFVAILGFGLYYLWKKGALEWD